MRLKIMMPTKVFIDLDVTKVVAEAENGSFGILPKHIDFVAALVPGILSFEYNNEEEFLAIDEGILVKWGSDVSCNMCIFCSPHIRDFKNGTGCLF